MVTNLFPEFVLEAFSRERGPMRAFAFGIEDCLLLDTRVGPEVRGLAFSTVSRGRAVVVVEVPLRVKEDGGFREDCDSARG